MAKKYNVFGAPKTIINETFSVDGAVSEEVMLDNLLKAIHSADRT